jgi:hypothetical protein
MLGTNAPVGCHVKAQVAVFGIGARPIRCEIAVT